ncbi:SRPBCC family protein [Acuticoccus sp.]|uniref:SRPBCC family protein n=1 Tax=Acuticoccus sp. TaxID=1904378 RepID=UPI003B526279
MTTAHLTDLRAGRPAPTMPPGNGYRMVGAGTVTVPIDRWELWDIVMDERRLAAAIPGAETLRRADEDGARVYAADVGIGVGFVRGTWHVTARFAECVAPESLVLFGGARGPLGNSTGEGWVDFDDDPTGTRVSYAYAILISGTVARVGGRLLDAAAGRLIAKFFTRLAHAVERGAPDRADQVG